MSNTPSHLEKSAQKRTSRVVDSVKNAMAIMEQEIKNSDGIYSYNGGRLSIAEVCRRADVHPITIMGKRHKDTTRILILNWIESLSGTLIEGKVPIRREITKRVVSAEDRYRLIASEFQKMYQVEIPRRDDEIEALRQEVAALEEENLRLQEQVAQGRVVRLRK